MAPGKFNTNDPRRNLENLGGEKLFILVYLKQRKGNGTNPLDITKKTGLSSIEVGKLLGQMVNTHLINLDKYGNYKIGNLGEELLKTVPNYPELYLELALSLVNALRGTITERQSPKVAQLADSVLDNLGLNLRKDFGISF
ncbi:MAG: hypothetical protein KGH61_00295 [Candidatus Micrarchaeota archaeon]|nr:hypothetical protein [Candidatus Micrarchaeota archaeon]MDE1847376.1 hypothetical protein [Candidatus Micrarchaeota archaeon]MDE1863991.1 hypothetical protein [Candidatus Micrarchaeota archaeon]